MAIAGSLVCVRDMAASDGRIFSSQWLAEPALEIISGYLGSESPQPPLLLYGALGSPLKYYAITDDSQGAINIIEKSYRDPHFTQAVTYTLDSSNKLLYKNETSFNQFFYKWESSQKEQAVKSRLAQSLFGKSIIPNDAYATWFPKMSKVIVVYQNQVTTYYSYKRVLDTTIGDTALNERIQMKAFFNNSANFFKDPIKSYYKNNNEATNRFYWALLNRVRPKDLH